MPKGKGENMRSQLIKRMSMLLTVGLALVTGAVSANGQSRTIVAQVPFDFIVGGQTLPAGRYTVNPAKDDRTELLIQNSEAGKSLFQLTNSTGPIGKDMHARLVFHRYGGTYFLAEVWESASHTGRRVLPSKQERSMRRELAAKQTKHEVIEVAAKTQ
jgi:hypothetical protein